MKIIFFANTDWYLYNFRLPLAKAVRDLGTDVILLTPPGKYVEKLKEEGFRCILVEMHRRSLNPLTELCLLIKIIGVYLKERPAIVHHFTLKCVMYGSISAYCARVTNCVNAITGMGFVFTSGSYLARILRPFVESTLKLILNGQNSRLILQNPDDVSALISKNIISPDRVRLIRGSGVNTAIFKPDSYQANARADSKESIVKVLISTRLLLDKGIIEFVESARYLKLKAKVSIDFLIAGSPDPGNPSSVTLDQINRWVEQKFVNYLGHVDQMEKLLTKVDIVVLPSYREGVPRILIEAAASGLPLVATDVPGCREIVKNGVNGLLVPVRDSSALAAAIQYLAENPAERLRMGEAGREIAINEFDERIVISSTLSVYHELVPEFNFNTSSVSI